jgi:TIR domain
MFKQVFISHAKEDYEVAEMLYNYLSENGYSPWLDKKIIRVGENWDYAIKKALKESTFVILLLSSTSVKKRGYVQREFKYALEYSETMIGQQLSGQKVKRLFYMFQNSLATLSH